MANRKPLVLVAGQIQQLQAGDTLDAAQSGGDQQNMTNDEVGAVVIGAPVYNDVADGFKKAQANAAGTKDVVGLVAKSPSIAAAQAGPVTVSGVLTATTAEWDAVAGTTGGLGVKTRYYLDAATSGKITATAPSSVGQYVVEVGISISPTELKVDVKAPILL